MSGIFSVRMSIPVLNEDNTVGNLKACCECIFKEEEKNLFPKSLIGTIIQDSGTRERRDDYVSLYVFY